MNPSQTPSPQSEQPQNTEDTFSTQVGPAIPAQVARANPWRSLEATDPELCLRIGSAAPALIGSVCISYAGASEGLCHPYRTIVWEDGFSFGPALGAEIDSVFQVLLGDSSFTLQDPEYRARVAVHCDFESGGETLTLEDAERYRRFCEAIADYDRCNFVRIDYMPENGPVTSASFSKRDPDIQEITMMLEDPVQFSPEAIRWFLSHSKSGQFVPLDQAAGQELVERFLSICNPPVRTPIAQEPPKLWVPAYLSEAQRGGG